MKSPTEVTIHIAEDHDSILRAKQLVHARYLEVGFISKSFPGGIIPFEYDHRATFMIATKQTGEIVGTIRITEGPDYPMLDAWKNRILPQAISLVNTVRNGKSFELGAVAVKKEFASNRIAHQLYVHAYNYCTKKGLDYGIICVEDGKLDSLSEFGWKIFQVGEPIMHFGSMTILAIVPVSQQFHTV